MPKERSIQFCFESDTQGSKAGAGNYFRPRATLRLYLCLAGQIQVKKAYSKLKN